MGYVQEVMMDMSFDRHRNGSKSVQTLVVLVLLGIVLFAAGRHFVNNQQQIDHDSMESETQLSTNNSNAQNEATEQQEEMAPNEITAQSIVSDINVGWNLGNSLDSCVNSGRTKLTESTAYHETAWGNPVVTKEFIDAVCDAGFSAIRIPVTWYYNTYQSEESDYQIRTVWLERVKEVVDYAIDNDVYVILNSHHDAPILWASMADVDEVSQNVIELWTQIAIYFKDYDDHLLFESFNEINTKDDSWQYSKSAAMATNVLNQQFVNVVRNTGGNNDDRVLICGTLMNGSTSEVLDDFVLPTDSVSNRLIAEVHNYSVSYNQDVEELMQRLAAFSERIQAPVIIGEFGSLDNFEPAELRDEHAGNFVARAYKYGIKCFWWDNGGDYKIFDRESCSVVQPEIVNALMNPVEYEVEKGTTQIYDSIDDYTYGTINAKDGEIMAWDSGALTLNPDNKGMEVTGGKRYYINLVNIDEGDGMRMVRIGFYDEDQNYISSTKPAQTVKTEIKVPQDTAYMRISFYNPWGHRSRNNYASYLANGKLRLEIFEIIE